MCKINAEDEITKIFSKQLVKNDLDQTQTGHAKLFRKMSRAVIG